MKRPLRLSRLTTPAILAALTAAGAIITIPLPGSPVPITLQTFFVLLSGAVAGPRDGAIAMVVYLLLGAAGMPVFSMMRGGLAVLLGPTGGYLSAFPLAALVTGLACGGTEYRSPVRTVLAMGAALALVYAGGVARLSWLTGKPPSALLATAVIPFLPGELLKIAAATLVAERLKRRRR